MNQARNDGAHDDGWYHDDHGLPPSLGGWPLGRTYVHSSDGALNTGPATNGPGGPSGASGPATNGHRGRPGASGPATNRRRRGGAPDPTPPQSGRPPLYQVGGRYRGDDWPTDPGFRRGDLGLDEPLDDPAAGGPDPASGEPRPAPAPPSLYPRLVFPVVGYAAITSLAAAYAQAIPLPVTASLIVIPAAGLIFSMGMRHPDWGRRALVGWIAGVVAAIVYDMLRLSLARVGIWGDPIPPIGRLVLADPHANFAWGYLWRFAGHGGGMGIAYTMLAWRGVRSGIAYGTLICSGLVALLLFFPAAQVHFFPLTPVTAAGAYAGHWVYGVVLARITSWWLPPVELGGRRR